MTYKQIEASREARLWIGQVIVPTAVAIGVACTNPNVRKVVSEKASGVKRFFKTKFKKD